MLTIYTSSAIIKNRLLWLSMLAYILKEKGQNEGKYFFIQCNILRNEDRFKVTSSKYVLKKEYYTYV